MNNRKSFLTAAALMAAAVSASAIHPLWVRDVKISPDGKRIAFTYQGDIYTVPFSGGNATRLTTESSYESAPIWSPDGSMIAFASDRNGGKDLYIIPSAGGAARRLTFNSSAETPQAFSPDGKQVYFSAVIQDPAVSPAFPSGRLTELYAVNIDGSGQKQILPTPALNLSVLPDGKFFYEDMKGMEDIWRKHHTSSVTRDIWLFDPATGKHTNLTDHAGEDLSPAVSPGAATLYFLSERNGGSLNVYAMPLTNPPSAPQKITDFKDHPVRFLSVGDDDRMAFTFNGELYTMLPGAAPVPVKVNVPETTPPDVQNVAISSADEALPSPDGKQVAYISRGEVFVTSTEYPSVKQITNTPAIETGLSWGADGRTLYYGSLRNGKSNIYKASIVRADDPNFSNATLIKEEPLFADDGIDRGYPVLSPDGKKMAFVYDRNKLTVMDLKSKEVKKYDSSPITNYRSGGFNMEWAPDNRLIAIEVMNPMHEPYGDISIVDTKTGEFIPVTMTGYFDQMPHWSADGNALIFSSERYGMRNHASWGSEGDVMMAFLNKEAYDKFRLSEEDYTLLKEVEKQQKKDAEKKDASKDSKGKKGKDKKNKAATSDESKKSESKDIVLEKDGIMDRIVRLTPNSSHLADYILSKDGETLYFLSKGEKGYDLWKKNLRKGDVSIAKKLGGSPAMMVADKDGEIFIIGSNVQRFSPKGGDLKSVSISTKAKIDPAKEREVMLDFVENEARERFYLPEMPVDWTAYVNNYRRFLPHITDNHDFADLLSELLGELNVSHSGARYFSSAAVDQTASLGLIFNLTQPSRGLEIEEVMAGGPFDRATSKVKAGDIVTAINGVEITPDSDWATAMNNVVGKKTLVSFSRPSSGEKWDEVVLPISAGKMNSLLYNRWVKARAHEVDSLSGGRLGYVHIQSMDDASFRKVYADLLGKYVDREGIVIDTRWNGGGRLHEDIEVLFSGQKYLTQEIHGRKSSEMPSRRWNKPSIMIIGEANYSNAHGTPWVYKKKNLGKLVGMPVPGTMSSVNWIDLQNPRMLFGVPVCAFRTEEGTVLENSQLEPDVKVANSPEDIANGYDRQLETAVRTLLRDLDANKK
ncbi:MAG: PDZ domain-containing protein [Muribaculaceae bacterium]|nr:PDZ domain-containing protein [Muribaculaceae bacterium]